MCTRGPKVSTNGCFWSLGNRIQGRSIVHLSWGRQPGRLLLFLILFSRPCFLDFFVLVHLVPFVVMFQFCFVSLPLFRPYFSASLQLSFEHLFILFSFPSFSFLPSCFIYSPLILACSPVLLIPLSSSTFPSSPLSSLPLSRWCDIRCPTFLLAAIEHALYMWPHTCMNTVSVHLGVSPSICLPLFASLFSDGEERSRSLSDEGMQTGWIWWVSSLFYDFEINIFYEYITIFLRNVICCTWNDLCEKQDIGFFSSISYRIMDHVNKSWLYKNYF